MAREEEREDERRRRRSDARRKAREAIREEAVDSVLQAAGAKRVDGEARSSLRALVEEELARYAEEAVDVARERGQDSVNGESVALAAARRSRAEPSF